MGKDLGRKDIEVYEGLAVSGGQEEGGIGRRCGQGGLAGNLYYFFFYFVL